MTKTIEKEVKKTLLITNYTKEDFSHKWDSAIYNFEAGQSMMMEAPLAFHFARHLAIRELNKAKKPTSGEVLRKEIAKALTSTKVESTNETQLAQEIINYNSMKKKDLQEKAVEKGIETEGKKKDELVKELEGFSE